MNKQTNKQTKRSAPDLCKQRGVQPTDNTTKLCSFPPPQEFMYPLTLLWY